MDLHLYERKPDGLWHYGNALAGHDFPDAALEGCGTIAGVTVRCDAAEWSLRWHTGYPPRALDRLDVSRLCTKFGLDLPTTYR